MLPTLREERRKTYSPILPISPTTGRVLQVPVEVVDADAGTIAFTDEDGARVEQSALGGRAKLQWKVDWAMRWVALGVDYEMYGKDLTDSGGPVGPDRGAARRPQARGADLRDVPRRKGREDLQVEGQRPEHRGVADLRLARTASPSTSTASPKGPRRSTSASSRARSTNIGSSASKYADQPIEQQLGNPVHHIHAGDGARAAQPAADLRPAAQPRLAARGPGPRRRLALRPALRPRHLARIRPRARRADRPRDQLRPRFRRSRAQAPRRRPAHEIDALPSSTPRSPSMPEDAAADDIQNAVFEIGKRHPFESAARLVPGALRNAARLAPGPAHGQLHRALRHRQYAAG